MCGDKLIVPVDLSDFINLRLMSLEDKYEKSEKLLDVKATELSESIKATYVTIREMNDKFELMTKERDEKLERSTSRYYATLAAIAVGFTIAFIYHIFGG